MTDANVFSDVWDPDEDWYGGGGRSKRLPRGPELGASVYELGPGNYDVYHFHHGSEELLIVLSGRPTLRTPGGERRLEPGDVVHFPVGPDGAHSLSNETREPARVVMVSTLRSPEVVEYPDLSKVTAQARTDSQTGERLFLIHDLQSPEDSPERR